MVPILAFLQHGKPERTAICRDKNPNVEAHQEGTCSSCHVGSGLMRAGKGEASPTRRHTAGSASGCPTSCPSVAESQNQREGEANLTPGSVNRKLVPAWGS